MHLSRISIQGVLADPRGVTKYWSQPITSREPIILKLGVWEHCELYVTWDYRYWYMLCQSKSHTSRECSQIYPGIVRQSEEGHIPQRGYIEHSPKLTSDVQAWVKQHHCSQPEGWNRGYVEPLIPEIQALIACRRTVFGLLVSGRMDAWMARHSMVGWIASRPGGSTDRQTR